MKKGYALFLAIFMSASGVVLAQNEITDNRERFQFGVKAGLNFSNVYDSKTEGFSADPKAGFVSGLFIRIPVTRLIGIQPEMLISQKGFKGQGTLFGSDYNFTRTTTYLDLPLQIALHPNEFFTVLAGPQLSYLIRQKDVFTSSAVSYTQEQEFANDNVHKNIVGFVGGVDLNLKHIVLGVRMGWDLRNNHGDGNRNTPRYKNTWFQTTLAYTFYSY